MLQPEEARFVFVFIRVIAAIIQVDRFLPFLAVEVLTAVLTIGLSAISLVLDSCERRCSERLDIWSSRAVKRHFER